MLSSRLGAAAPPLPPTALGLLAPNGPARMPKRIAIQSARAEIEASGAPGSGGAGEKGMKRARGERRRRFRRPGAARPNRLTFETTKAPPTRRFRIRQRAQARVCFRHERRRERNEIRERREKEKGRKKKEWKRERERRRENGENGKDREKPGKQGKREKKKGQRAPPAPGLKRTRGAWGQCAGHRFARPFDIMAPRAPRPPSSFAPSDRARQTNTES